MANKKSFVIEDKQVKVSKDCQTCSHLNICKFHKKMSDLCKSNEFYEMTKYLEWNNSLRVFELHASCQYFKLNYDIPEDRSLNLKINVDIINEIASLERPKDCSSYSVRLSEEKVVYGIYKKVGEKGEYSEEEVKLVDLLSGYKFL